MQDRFPFTFLFVVDRAPMFFWLQDLFGVDVWGVSRIIGKEATKSLDLIPWLGQQILIINQVWKRYIFKEFLRICFPVWFFEHFLVTAKMTIWIRKWLILFSIREWHCNFLILWVIIIFMHIKLLLHYNQKHLKVFVLLALNVLYYWGDKSDHFIVNNSPPFDGCNQILQLNRTKPSPISECCVLFHFFDTIEHSFGSLSINVTPFFFFLRGDPATLCFFIN